MSTTRTPIYLVTNSLTPKDRATLVRNVRELGGRVLSDSLQVISSEQDESLLAMVLAEDIVARERINLVLALGPSGATIPLTRFAALTA
jgi:hypothetical protein